MVVKEGTVPLSGNPFNSLQYLQLFSRTFFLISKLLLPSNVLQAFVRLFFPSLSQFTANAHIIRLMNVMLTVRSVFRQFEVNCTEVFGSYDLFVFLDFISLWFIINCEMRY